MLTMLLTLWAYATVAVTIWPFILLAVGIERPGLFGIIAPIFIPLMLVIVPIALVLSIPHSLRPQKTFALA